MLRNCIYARLQIFYDEKMKNKEIEIKLRLSKKDLKRIKSFLDSNAQLLKEVTQDDQYYQPKDGSYIQEDGSIYEWMRIRIEGDTSILCYKFIHAKAGSNRNKDEIETEVKNPSQLHRILMASGFDELVRVIKKRQAYIFEYENHKYEIAIDTIQDLGSFIEIEIKGNFKNVKEANEGIEKVANLLGLNLEKENRLGYAHMLLIKNGDAKKPEWVSEEELEYSLNG